MLHYVNMSRELQFVKMCFILVRGLSPIFITWRGFYEEKGTVYIFMYDKYM